MPLSDHEQRILAELEESLTKQDPRFAKNVRETNIYSHSGRRVRWGVVGFIVGLAILVLFFSQSIALGLIGVGVMFVSAIVIERNARKFGRASLHDISRRTRGDDANLRPGNFRDWFHRRPRPE